ncbi:MAG: peptidylprolyl isomerase [Methanophagales archaeon]|nr:peptidylprolyl isomerase [Methanophagales archaeon]
MKRIETLLLLMVVVIGAVLASGCVDTEEETKSMASTTEVVKAGDYVQVDYVGKLKDGTVFDTSIEKIAKDSGKYNPNRAYQPLGFKVGAGQMIPGFDKGVVGMAVAEKKTLTIPPEDAYGHPREDMLITQPIEDVTKAGITPEVGLSVRTNQGMSGTIIKVTDTEVVVDFNHELAGKTLVFDVTLVSIGKEG